MNKDLGRVLGQHVHVKYFRGALKAYMDPEKQLEFLDILNNTCVSNRYKQVVLRWFIFDIENASMELDGDVAAEYATLLVANQATSTAADDPIQSLPIVSYRYHNDGVLGAVSIREDPWVIAQQGSTGHRTWEAALALGSYLLANPQNLQHMEVLELGCGTGFVGILAAQTLTQNKVMVSDGVEQVVDSARENVRLNGLGDRVEAQTFWWGKDKVQEVQNSQRVMLCADVTYDGELIEDLVAGLKQSLSLESTAFGLLAATMRSLDTFKRFEHESEQHGIKIRLMRRYTSPFDEVEFFIPPENPDICIYKLTV